MLKSGNRFGPLLSLVAVIWAVYLLNLVLPADLRAYGIRPRSVQGLIGIITSPFLHGNLTHITGNSVSLIIFGVILSLRGRAEFLRVAPLLIVLAGLGVWLLALNSNSNHIGASGLVFGMFGYIVTCGFYDRKVTSIMVSIVVFLAFGGILWGVLPVDAGISWEGHLFGLLGGYFVARNFRKNRS